MNLPQIYSEHQDLQQCDAKYVLKNYLGLISWRCNDHILDVGCGDGTILVKLLLPEIPNDFGKIVGIDISEEMINFAKRTHHEERIQFRRIDVSVTSLPMSFSEEFDHIFSFHCLHWIVNLKQAVKNLYTILKPGGDALLYFLVRSPVVDIFERMVKIPRWTPYMRNLSSYVSPYQHLEDPVGYVKNVFKEVGFRLQLFKVEERIYSFANESSFRNIFIACNPFIKNVPNSELEDYLHVYDEESRKLEYINVENCSNKDDGKNESKITYTYRIFIVHALKPSESLS